MDIEYCWLCDRCLDSSFVSIKIETNNTKNRIHSTMEYIKDRYFMYNSFNEAVEARSLVRMVEKVQQTARNFKIDKQELEKEYLKQYAREQRLTGIIVLNDKNKQIAQYHTGPRFKKVLGYVMEKETLRDVKNYPQKSYMARIELKREAISIWHRMEERMQKERL